MENMSLIITDMVEANLKWESITEKVLCPLIIEAAYYQIILQMFNNLYKCWHEWTHLHLPLSLFHRGFLFVCSFSHGGPSIIPEVIDTDQAPRGPQSKNNKRGHYRKFGKLKMNVSELEVSFLSLNLHGLLYLYLPKHPHHSQGCYLYVISFSLREQTDHVASNAGARMGLRTAWGFSGKECWMEAKQKNKWKMNLALPLDMELRT